MVTPPGLEGIVAEETHLSHVDGLKGELVIAGFPLASLAANATFEETVFLLWNGRLPTPTTTADQSYPLTAPLYFVSADTAEPTGALRALLAWMQSDVGQEALTGGGYGRVR